MNIGSTSGVIYMIWHNILSVPFHFNFDQKGINDLSEDAYMTRIMSVDVT